MALQPVIRIISITLLVAGIATGCGGGSGERDIDPPPPPALNISNATLADGVLGVPYNQTITAGGGTGARTFSISAGVLPAGLSLNSANGVISGTPLGPTGVAGFTATVVDSGTPQQSDSQALQITVNAQSLGRNDTIADATALGNGTFRASISPSGDPGTIFDPDEDFYAITTTAASTVTVDINAQTIGSPLDSVIEIVGANGIQLATCTTTDSICVHDDETLGVNLDSILQVQIAGATTFYVHVVDFGASARPDKIYDLVISGVN